MRHPKLDGANTPRYTAGWCWIRGKHSKQRAGHHVPGGLLPPRLQLGRAEPSQASELLFPGQIICISTTVPPSSLSFPCLARPQRPEIQQAKSVTAHPCRRQGQCPPSATRTSAARQDAQRCLACEVLALLCFAARQPDQPFPAGLKGLLSLIPPEFQATNFGDSHVVHQQPAHTHSGACLLWRRQLLQLLRNKHGCLADAQCYSL